MTTRLLFIFSLLCTTFVTVAQQKQTSVSCTLKGILIDSITRESEPYATIKITKKEVPTKAIKVSVTDANGKFQEKISATPGDYLISISSIGKVPVAKSFEVNPDIKVINLDTFYTADAASELKGVEVVAQKPLVKVDVDKIEYNIQDDPDSKTNTVMEMLRKVPLVTVDGEDNIQVNGSSSFKIHVNGKPNNMMSNNPKEVLKSMPANTIKYIEVITSPGAKYDAEGVGGILNIVTVEGGFEGYTATFRASGSNYGAGAGAYATIKKGKFTVTANYNYNYNNQPRSMSEQYRENTNPEEITQKYLESNRTSKYNGSFQFGNIEASYEIDTLRLLTMGFGMYGGSNNSDGNSLTTMWNANREQFAYQYNGISKGKGSWYSIRGNLDYQRTFKKNKDRMLTLSYKIDTQPQTDNSNSVYDIDPTSDTTLIRYLQLVNAQSTGKTNTTEHTFQGDFTTPIGKLHTIEAGLKYIFRDNNSNNKFFEDKLNANNYEYNNNRSSHYQHFNHIFSAYLGYKLVYKIFSFKPGLRYEYTYQQVKYLAGAITSDANFSTDYGNLVPSVSLGFKIGNSQSINANYNMRIWRPGIWNLNPYFDNRSPMFISQGNPNLDSEKSHAFNLSYSTFSPKFNANVSLRYAFNNNGIESVSRLIGEGGEWFDNDTHYAPAGALYSTYQNIGKSNGTALSFYLNWNPTPNARIYINGRGNYSDIKSPSQNLHNYGWSGSAYGGVQYTFPLKIRAGLNGGGSTPNIRLQGRSSGYYYYSLNVNYSFLKDDRLNISAYATNVFEQYRSYSNLTTGENFISRSYNRYPSRNYGINISYRIGELKATVKKASRSIENDDVKGGGDSGGGGQGGS